MLKIDVLHKKNKCKWTFNNVTERGKAFYGLIISVQSLSEPWPLDHEFHNNFLALSLSLSVKRGVEWT